MSKTENSTAPLRKYELCEDGHWYDTIEAVSLEAALAVARDNVDSGNYEYEGTLWLDVRARDVETGETDRDTVALDPPEPECTKVKHDWQSPHEIVGGIEENPGCWGHGGGVIMTAVCMHCGCARITDTWAQRPDTGEQGLTSVSYEAGKYDDQVEAMRERESA